MLVVQAVTCPDGAELVLNKTEANENQTNIERF